MRRNVNGQDTNRQYEGHSALVIFDHSPMRASTAVEVLSDLGLSDAQIARYFRASVIDIKARRLARGAARRAAE
jgi:hypothetical protein